MEAAYLIQSAERIGSYLKAEGENIRVYNIKYLPVSLIDEIKSHKRSLLKILRQDEAAKQAGFIVVFEGELYTRTLGKKSAVYIEKIDRQWKAWRETHIAERREPISVKEIVADREFDFVLLKIKDYFNYLEEKRHERK